ncbi:MAG TPA: hypothetical protein VGC79_14370, partial [Polyangiaceae bacterium]
MLSSRADKKCGDPTNVFSMIGVAPKACETTVVVGFDESFVHTSTPSSSSETGVQLEPSGPA